MTKSQVRGMFAAYVVSMVLMLGAIMGSWWYLDNYLGEIRNDIRVLSTRMGSLADKHALECGGHCLVRSVIGRRALADTAGER